MKLFLKVLGFIMTGIGAFFLFYGVSMPWMISKTGVPLPEDYNDPVKVGVIGSILLVVGLILIFMKIKKRGE